jgi:Protein of unknown function (DUF2946)
MKWFRSNIRHGSRLALFALIVQFMLSFGHFHGSAGQAASAVQVAQAFALSYNDGLLAAEEALSQSARQQPASNHDSDQHSSDACAICAVIGLANTVLFAMPPLLLLPQAIEFLHVTTDAEFIHLNSARVPFQPRAPPTS